MMNGMGFGGMWFGWLFWLVILAVIVWAVVTVVNKNQKNNYNGNPLRHGDALEILKERYARGEINRDQFEQMKRDLTS